MSYCRWSSNDYQCDVYVYEDVSGGWTTMVAEMKYVYKDTLPPPVDIHDFDACMKRGEKVQAMLDTADLVPIGLPCDGETLNDPTPGQCADRLEKLKNMGYVVPQSVIDDLRKEERGK